jgi:hypothetical protein
MGIKIIIQWRLNYMPDGRFAKARRDYVWNVMLLG